jgi:hypothetical protein
VDQIRVFKTFGHFKVYTTEMETILLFPETLDQFLGENQSQKAKPAPERNDTLYSSIEHNLLSNWASRPSSLHSLSISTFK